jgi:hypothetical protein
MRGSSKSGGPITAGSPLPTLRLRRCLRLPVPPDMALQGLQQAIQRDERHDVSFASCHIGITSWAIAIFVKGAEGLRGKIIGAFGLITRLQDANIESTHADNSGRAASSRYDLANVWADVETTRIPLAVSHQV